MQRYVYMVIELRAVSSYNLTFRFNCVKGYTNFEISYGKNENNLDALHKNEKHIDKESQIKS